MNTFQETYCAERGCRSEEFAARIFWCCLHRRALVFAPVLAALCTDYFAADRELITAAGRARTRIELDEELRDFRYDARNRDWWRRQARVRLSTQRLRRIAYRHLPAAPAGRS